MMRRRGFLGLLGGAAVAGPKSLAETAARGLPKHMGSGLSTAARYGDNHDNMTGTSINETPDENPIPQEFMGRFGFLEFVKRHGVPEHIRMQWMRESQYIDRLDVDLAENRSMSTAGKIHVQRQRNYERCEQRYFDRDGEREHERFYERWPWARYFKGL